MYFDGFWKLTGFFCNINRLFYGALKLSGEINTVVATCLARMSARFILGRMQEGLPVAELHLMMRGMAM